MNSPIAEWADAARREPREEADFATLRVLGRTTIGKSFALRFGHLDDIGAPARTVWQVIAPGHQVEPFVDGEEEEHVLHQSPAGRVQVKARVVRERGRVSEIRFERSSGQVGAASLVPILNLDEEASRRLIDLCFALRGIDPQGEETLRIDDQMLAALLESPQAMASLYDQDPTRFNALIESDVTAKDVIAIAARREAVEKFERLLIDPDYFDEVQGSGGREAVWQRFFEDNPWLLGVGLSGQLLTSWDEGKLERVVAGSSVSDVGKRVDALLTTNGVIRSLVFAEFKLHDDPLLETASYRPGTWAPSRHLVSGVAQAQVTADRARDDLGTWLASRDDSGIETGERVYSATPRSFVVIGSLHSLAVDGHPQSDLVRSFELYRRHLSYPEVVTYDELLARARWTLDVHREN